MVWDQLLFVPLIFGVLALVPGTADACSIIKMYLEIDPQQKVIDFLPPDQPVVSVKSINRGRGPRRTEGRGAVMTSCDDIGSIGFEIGPVSDDLTKPAELGFLFQVVEGTLPSGLSVPAKPLVTISEKTEYGYYLHWTDGATDDQEPFEFTLVVVAVDKAGNHSEESDPVTVRHPGSGSYLERS